ncbi:MAG TPA: hypothetical protein VM261_32205 [Kofleriaceae bacterium]|nr:hypothetical protein [Kofleriaceae bacterium]
MRRRLVPMLLAAAAGSASAQPAVWSEPDPAAVVGRWRATITWRGCAATGAARAVLDVARDGSGYALDLAPVLDGLGPQVLVPFAAKKLEATRDDLRVEWTTGKHNRATLAVRFASGCTGTLALTREGTGAPACDELAALQAIAGRCDGVAPTVLSDDERTIIAGAARPGRARTAAARTCGVHATPLRASLVEAGCVPAPSDATAGGIRIPECEALVVAVSRLMRCEKVPADAKQRLHAGMQRVARWATVAPGPDAEAERTRAAATCEQARVDLVETMTIVGC